MSPDVAVTHDGHGGNAPQVFGRRAHDAQGFPDTLGITVDRAVDLETVEQADAFAPHTLDMMVPRVDFAVVEPDASSTTPAVSTVSSQPRYDVRVTRDVVYGQGVTRPDWTSPHGEVFDLLLDAYEPIGAPAQGKPVLIAIHGGGFTGGHRRQAQIVAFCEYFAQRGWVTFSIDYRLARHRGQVPADWPVFPGVQNVNQYLAMYVAARDAKAAVRWVHAHVDHYGIHPDYITALGGSAGSFLAIMLGVSDPSDYRDEISVDEDPTLASTHLEARSDVATVIDHWGGASLLHVLLLQDGSHRFDADDAPISIVHGRDDRTVTFDQGEDVRNLCMAAGLDHEFYPFQGGHAAWGTRIHGLHLTELAFEFVVSRQSLNVQE